ncbi:SH3 domain-containing protein [Bacillus thuringiensis]|uniref:SH3 domain-containing protein n=2 Tax=Bacillus TaxID=1386 RepID=UPI001300C8AA|nr:SH3 domain-containing protein [Bacillus thuringiensis]
MKKRNHKNKKLVIPACVLASSMILGGIAQAATYKTTDPLKIREGTTTDSNKLGLLHYDSSVETNKIKNGWATINYKGKDAHVSANYLRITDVENYDFAVNGDGVRIRTLPNIKTGKVIGGVNKGFKLEVIEQDDNGWYKVRYKGKIGFITNQYVTVNQKGSTKPAEKSNTDEIVIPTEKPIGGNVAKSEVKLDNKQESKPEVKPDNKQESKSEVKPDNKQETKPEVKPDNKQESKSEVKLDNKQESKSEVKLDNKQESKPEVKPDNKQETKPEVKPDNKQESKPEVKPETKPEVTPPTNPGGNDNNNEAQKPGTQKPDHKQTIADKMTTLGDAEQLVLVTAEGYGTSYAKITTFEKKDGNWNEVHTMNGRIGKDGFANKMSEEVTQTPRGKYDIGMAFGRKGNPGTKMQWHDIQPDDVWVDDSNSSLYNTLQKKPSNGRWNSAENMNVSAYDYGFVINYNTERTPGAGSAIFFHVSSAATYGCTGASQQEVINMLKWLDPNKQPVIIQTPVSEIGKY